MTKKKIITKQNNLGNKKRYNKLSKRYNKSSKKGKYTKKYGRKSRKINKKMGRYLKRKEIVKNIKKNRLN